MNPQILSGLLSTLSCMQCWTNAKVDNLDDVKTCTTFHLYNRKTLKNPEKLDKIRMTFSTYSQNLRTKILIHGWMGRDNIRFCKTMKEELLALEDLNLIVIDWSKCGSRNIIYNAVRNKVKSVADLLAKFLDNFSKHHASLENIHIIGHSLGAHIGGRAGYQVKTGKIGRITGLDPANPLFHFSEPYKRLSNTSARFVDVIHTCGYYLGLHGELGHADFFPNSGSWRQPGCGMDFSGFCSHRRSYHYYLESFKNRKAFPAVSCAKWTNFLNKKCNYKDTVYMGEGLENRARGSYFLKTASNPPFGLPIP